MAKYQYNGDNVRTLDPSNAPVSKEYKFFHGGAHEIAEADEQLFAGLPEFERVEEAAAAAPEEKTKRGR